jgi:hypothetical protein
MEAVQIKWLDSGLSYTDGWKSFNEIIAKAKLAIVTTVGFKFYEDDEALYIALSVHENDAYGVQVIAKKNVVSIDWLNPFYTLSYMEKEVGKEADT